MLCGDGTFPYAYGSIWESIVADHAAHRSCQPWSKSLQWLWATFRGTKGMLNSISHKTMLNLSNNSKSNRLCISIVNIENGLSPLSFMNRKRFVYSLLTILKCQFQARKELATVEGFKQDYNFLWRLLGRVHAARGAIQCLMGEEVSCSPTLFPIFASLAGSIFHLVVAQTFNRLASFIPTWASHTSGILKLCNVNVHLTLCCFGRPW